MPEESIPPACESHAGPSIPLDPIETPTVSIPEAGRFLGLDRSASYRAAKSGYLPTVQVSERRWVVPTARLLELLGLTLDRDSIVGGES